MRLIHLNQGLVTRVDDADHAMLSIHRWYDMTHHHTHYARTVIRGPRPRKNLLMHRVIMGLTTMGGLNMNPNLQVDHIDGDGLNNQRSNLRIVTPGQNQQNQIRVKKDKIGISRYKGVVWEPDRGKWHASICFGHHKVHLGRFVDEEDAARAYDEAALQAWGEHSHLNLPV